MAKLESHLHSFYDTLDIYDDKNYLIASTITSITTSGNVNNWGLIESANLNLSSLATLSNIAGQIIISQGGTSDITVFNLDNQGLINAVGNLSITAQGKIDNSRHIITLSNLAITAFGSEALDGITNSGQILSQGSLTLNANNLTNNQSGDTQFLSLMRSFDDVFHLNISHNLLNNSEISSNSDVVISYADLLENYGTIAVDNDAKLTLTIGNLHNHYLLSANNAIMINASGNVDNRGNILSEKDITITANTGNITNRGNIQAGKNIMLNAYHFNNEGNIFGFNTYDQNDNILTWVTTSISASNDADNSGAIQSYNLHINSRNLDNIGLLLAFNKIDVMSDTISNQEGANIYSDNDLSLSSALLNGIIQNDGQILAINHLNIDVAAGLLENNSEIVAANVIHITARDLDNDGAAIINSTNMNSINAESEDEINHVDITTTNRLYNAGTIHGYNVAIAGASHFTNDGLVKSFNNTHINTANTLDNNANILGNHVTILEVTTLNNNADILSAASLNISANSIYNKGYIQGYDVVTIAADDFYNHGNILGVTMFDDVDNVMSYTTTSITVRNLFDNYQTIESYQLNILGLANFSNYANLASFNDINISTNSITNQDGATIDAGNDVIINSSQFTNNSNAKIDGNNVIIDNDDDANNAGQMTADNGIRISASNINNSGKIVSKDVILNAITGTIDNDNIIQADYRIIINAKLLDNSAMLDEEHFYNTPLIIAENDLIINAITIDNSNTIPAQIDYSEIKAGLASRNGEVVLKSTNITNDYGMIIAANVNSSYLMNLESAYLESESMATFANSTQLSSDSLVISNMGGSIISNAAIEFDLGNVNYTITGTISAARYVDISAASIINEGDITSLSYIILNATRGSIINGASGIGTAAQLKAATDLILTAKNHIINYGVLSSSNDLTLDASFIYNHSGASITGGEGVTTITTSLLQNGGSIPLFVRYIEQALGLEMSNNQPLKEASLTSNNDLVINVDGFNNPVLDLGNLENYGGIYAQNDITFNIKNNLTNNSTALIWSGNNSVYNVANVLTNEEAVLYAQNNLTIRKNDSDDRVNHVQNLSGQILTHAGDLVIRATTFDNKRSVDPFLPLLDPLNNTIYASGSNGETKIDNYDAYDWHKNNYGCFGHECGEKYYGYYAKQLVNDDSKESQINVAGTTTFDVYDFTNLASTIISQGAININVENTYINDAITDPGLYAFNYDYSFYNCCYDYGYSEVYSLQDVTYKKADPGNGLHYKSSLNYADYSQSFSSLIKSGSSILINGAVAIENEYTDGDDASVGIIDQMSKSTNYNKINPIALYKTGIIEVDLSQILSVIENNSTITSSITHNNSLSKVALNSLTTQEVAFSKIATKGTLSTAKESGISSKTSLNTQQLSSLTQSTITKKEATNNEISSQNFIADNIDNDATASIILPKDTLSNSNITPQKGAQDLIEDNIAQASTTSVTTSNPNKINLGLFTINLTPNRNKPLIEQRSEFTNASEFFGSDYMYHQFGIDRNKLFNDIEQALRQRGNDNQVVMLGDSFVETHLIEAELKSLRNDALYLSDNETDINQEMKTLLDNTIAEFTRLDLNLVDITLNGLTQTQTDSLEKDIISFETIEFAGFNVIAPKLYLSLGTRKKLLGNMIDDTASNDALLVTNSTIFAMEDITINSQDADLKNSGSIIARGNININVASLTNKTTTTSGAQIKTINYDTSSSAGGNISITASNDIKNIGADIKAINNLTLTSSDGNILNTAIVSTNDKNLLTLDPNSEFYLSNGNGVRANGVIWSDLIKSASIFGGSVNINASKDFTNQAASIMTSKNLLRDNTMTSGNLAISVGDDIEIKNLALRNKNQTSWGHASKGGIEIKDVTTNIGSNIKSAASIALITTKLGTDNETNALYQTDLARYNQQSLELTQQITDLKNTPIKSAFNSKASELKSAKLLALEKTLNNLESPVASNYQPTSNITITGSQITATDNITIASADNVNITSAQNNSYYLDAGRNGKGKSYSNKVTSTTQVSSAISSSNNGDIAIISGTNNIDTIGDGGTQGSIAIIASQIKTFDADDNASNNLGNGDISLIAKDNVMIASALDSYYEERHMTKKGIASKKGSTDIQQNVTNLKSVISATNDINIKSGDNTKLIAATINAGNDIHIEVGKYINEVTGVETLNENAVLNISAAKDIDYNYHHSYSTKMDLGAIVVASITGSLGTIAGAYYGSQVRKGNVTMSEIYDETLVSSQIVAGHDLNITSGSDINILSSHLKSDNNTTILAGNLLDKNNQLITTNSNASLNIASLEEVHVKKELHEKKKVDYVGVAAGVAFTSLVANVGMSVGKFAGTALTVGGAVTSTTGAVYGYYKGAEMVIETALETSQNKRISDVESRISNQISSSIESQNNMILNAQNNVFISASNLDATNNININANNGMVNIASVIESNSTKTYNQIQDFDSVSGGFNRGRISIDLNANHFKEKETVTQLTQKQSNITANNINITSEDDLNILASNVNANYSVDSSINLISRKGNINILSQENTKITQTQTEDSCKSPLIS